MKEEEIAEPLVSNALKDIRCAIDGHDWTSKYEIVPHEDGGYIFSPYPICRYCYIKREDGGRE